ncbi:MAG: helicase [Actinobacteria bacterium]|nr:helicase [Actinomycetota bacterium]
MPDDPELIAEQATIDRAYASLERMRDAARARRRLYDDGPGGTPQNRRERDYVWGQVEQRLAQLDIGDQSLVFGRIDFEPNAENPESEAFHVGRIAVSDENFDPVVVDWRAPIAEAFYRATGADPMGLRRRRHFATRGRMLLGMDDELFGSAAAALDSGTVEGHGALISALEEARTGRLSDIVATIQGEQDVVIRSPLPGVLVVQGGPGTGKTVVALHRAAFLLYTHRFPLEGQGVLVVGPNRVFLNYIEQVLPSLGEAGVQIAVLADLVPDIRAVGRDEESVARIKGDLRMIDVVARAVRDRERPLRETLRVPFGVQFLTMSVEQSTEIVADARRRFRTHNAARRHVERRFFEALAASSRTEDEPSVVRERVRHLTEVRLALERIWPVLTPSELLNDLFGSPGLLRSACDRSISREEWELLGRPRRSDTATLEFTHDDVPLLDEALERLGPVPSRRPQPEVRTYGHIVVDEAQDLSPMQLRMLDRRSLNGSMTVVGDIAQATGAWAHDGWESVLAHLPDRRTPRFAELRIGYRVPGPIMDFAARVLPLAAPGLEPPESIRRAGEPPLLVATGDEEFDAEVVSLVLSELAAVQPGHLAVVAPGSLVDRVDAALAGAGVPYGRASRQGLEQQVTLVPIWLVKGLELDGVVVIEPAAILAEEARGAQALYVALTRSTKRLAVLHIRPLPEVLVDTPSSGGDEDAFGGERSDAHVPAFDLDGGRPVG